MRENIGLYRGKPTERFRDFLTLRKEFCDDGFVYGSLVVSCGRYYICVFGICSSRSIINNGITTMVEVIPETIGQFTGLTDKNGKKIFEGDIIHTLYANCPKNEHIEKVVFFNGSFMAEKDGLYVKLTGTESPKRFSFDKSVYMIECEVIGNIHDNPELLGGEVK